MKKRRNADTDCVRTKVKERENEGVEAKGSSIAGCIPFCKQENSRP